jgi:phenylalanyl-tRNA synthetase beta chain
MKEIEGDNGVSVVVDDLNLGHIKEVGNLSFCELRLDDLLKLVRDEVSYRGLPKHPAVLRDISVLINDQVRIGNLIKEIQEIDLELIEDVDLVDEYFGKDDGKQSITLRIRFRSEEKTLSSDDVDVLMKKITDLLKNKFKCQIN